MTALPVILSGTIGGYIDLVAAINAWLDRDDLSDRVPEFLALCEARMNRHLRTVLQETAATWTVTSGAYELPQNYRKMRRLFVADTPNREIVEVSPQSVVGRYDGTPGVPEAYYIEGRTLNLAPPPLDTIDLGARYWSRIVPLTSTDDSNWLLEEHPDAYLTGSLLEAAIYIRDDEAIAFLEPRFGRIIEEIKVMSRGDQYGGGPMSPAGPRQVRGARC